jgi:hypothetical protein
LRAVSIENMESGALLAKTIYSGDGRVLLRKGSELGAKTIQIDVPTLFEVGLARGKGLGELE